MQLQDFIPRTTYYLKEGDLESVGTIITKTGDTEGFRFKNQIDKNTFVELVGDMTVGKATKSAMGIVISRPERSFQLAPMVEAELPELRFATVTRFQPNNLYSLPLSDTNTKITAGDYLVIGNDGKLTKGTTSDSGCVAEESKDANTGGYIEVSITAKTSIDVKTSSP